MLVDTHCHIMPDRLALAIRRFFDAHMSWGTLAYEGVTLADVVDAEREAGAARFWALPYAHKPGIAASLNQWMAREVKPIDGAVAAATFHPDDDDLPGLVDRAFGELGLGAAKLHCSVGRFVPDDERLEPLWLAAAERAIPIVVHAGHHQNGRTEAVELDPIDRVARAHPRLTLVIAHAALPDIDAALDLVERHDRVHVDLACAAEWLYPMPVDRIEALSDRVLFGSDAPNTTVKIADSAAWLAALGLSDPALARIRGGNAMRLIPD